MRNPYRKVIRLNLYFTEFEIDYSSNTMMNEITGVALSVGFTFLCIYGSTVVRWISSLIATLNMFYEFKYNHNSRLNFERMKRGNLESHLYLSLLNASFNFLFAFPLFIRLLIDKEKIGWHQFSFFSLFVSIFIIYITDLFGDYAHDLLHKTMKHYHRLHHWQKFFFIFYFFLLFLNF